MKHIDRFVFAALMLLLALPAWAYDFEVDGIYYNITNDAGPYEVTVTYRDHWNYNSYSGDVVIPSSVTYGEINYSVTSIGSSAFYKCDELTSLTIPTSVTTITGYIFSGCSSLASIVVEAGNPKYDSRGNCNAIVESETNILIDGCKTTIIPNSVTSIGDRAFYGCIGLTSVTIPNSVTSIGDYAFYGCIGLTSVTIPNSVTSIGDYAFYGCMGLTLVTIAESVTSIGIQVFASCPELSSIIVAIGNSVYDSRDNCNAVIETATNKIIAGCKGTVVPNTVVSIGKESFRGCKGMTTISIPNSVTKIEQAAFANSDLVSLNIPNSVTNIEWMAFGYCDSLVSIVIPNSITAIKDEVFRDCGSLASINIPNSVTYIGCCAFLGCKKLSSIFIPNSVTFIGEEAFSNCDSLNSIVVETGNPTYDSRNNCNAIIHTTTNELMTGCKNTIIPNSVISIGDGAFYYCTGLTSLSIPNSVTTVGDWAFYDCTGLTSLSIPNSVTSIGVYAFYGCKSLSSIVIPNSISLIEEGTFSYCYGLISINIPNSVVSIGLEAFSQCRSLESIKVLAETPPVLGNDAFKGVNREIPMYVPCGSEEAYASTSWGGFSNCYGICPGDVVVVSNPVGGGIVTGAGHYEGGETCTLTAMANEGFFFSSWKKDGTIVSRDPIYSFCVTGDASFEAYFASKAECIQFADANVKALCVSFWDTDGDGELSYDEARAVTDIAYFGLYLDDSPITTFDELQYFTGLTSIGQQAFTNCTLTSIIIPNSVTSIGFYAFSGCTGLISMTIPHSVDSIAGNPFSGCKNLTSIVVEEGNRRYDSRNNCNAIIETETNTLIVGCNSTVIPNTIVTIGSSAFYGSGLSSIDIPISVLSIENSAFGSCSELTSIDIPNSVLSIGQFAFRNCTKLSSLTIGRSVKEMRCIMDNCKNLNRINYNAVECVLVEAASAPGPFLRSATKTMVIGKEVMSLPRGFLNIEIEESIIVRAIVPPEYNGSCYSFDIPICVPTGSLAAYQNHELWGQFTNYSTSYLFDVRSSDETIGRVRILEQPDCYSESNIATVFAEPIGNHPFLSWTTNGQIVSTANPYTFLVEDDVDLVANFCETYSVGLHSSDPNLGSVHIIQQPNCLNNNMATVIAEPIGTHPFLNWTVNGQVVSTANPYTFVVDKDIELVGNFEGTGVDEAAEQRVSVSPNPTKNTVNIECENMKGIAVYTIDGRMAKTYDGLNANAVTLDMSDVPQGVYVLRVETRDGAVVNMRIVKE